MYMYDQAWCKCYYNYNVWPGMVQVLVLNYYNYNVHVWPGMVQVLL